jgi:hypothetical protein
MGQAQAGRSVVPWLWQHEGEVTMEETLPLQQDNLAQKVARPGPPPLVATFEFDRTRQARSTPWRLSGARVQLVDCTDPRLRGMVGVVQGWEPESGRILVRVQNLLVRVWPGECVRIQQDQEGQSGGERKRRTLGGSDAAAMRARHEVKRARGCDPQGSPRGQQPTKVRENFFGNLFGTVTSEGRREKQRGVIAGVVSGLKGTLRGIWKWTISRTIGGTPWGAKRKKDRSGVG